MSDLYKIIVFVDSTRSMLNRSLYEHRFMANLLIRSNLIKHSCTHLPKTSLVTVLLKTFFYCYLQWRRLTLRHDPKDLPFIDSSSPCSTVTDSVQTRKQKKPAADD